MSYGPVWVRQGQRVQWVATATDPYLITSFGDTVYYGDGAVTSSNYTGTLAFGASLTISRPTWFTVNAARHADGTPNSARLEISNAPNIAALEGAAGQRIYVHPTGDDSADGLSWGTALGTLAHAATVARGLGGAHIELAPGTHLLDPSSAGERFTWSTSNLRVSGVPGLTTIKPTSTDGRIMAGFDTYTTGGGQYHDFHLENLIFDFTDQPTTGGLYVCAVRDWSLRNVTINGGTFPFQIGGDILPAQRGRVDGLHIMCPDVAGGQFAIALVNADDVVIDGWRVEGPGAGVRTWGLLDCETNSETDYLRNVTLRNGVAQDINGPLLNNGATTDPGRCVGLRYVHNTHLNCGSASIAFPGVTFEDNTFQWTRRAYYSGSIPTGGLAVLRGGDYGLSPDRCSIRRNRFVNMGQNNAPGITLEGSHCVVEDNVVIDTHKPSKTSWAVEEVQRHAYVVQGVAAGSPSSMSVPYTAGVVQEDSAGGFISGTGTQHSVSAGTATIPTASSYDRIDLIQIRPDTQAVSVVQGAQPQYGLDPGPPHATYDAGLAWANIPLFQVYVPANATSIAASDIRDVRPFPPNNNTISQRASGTPLLYGSVRMRGNGSRLAVSRRRSTLDSYTLAVLADNPLIYLPLLETDGLVAQDYSGNGWDGEYVGGVLLNQQIGATSRYGAKFDGTTGYVQVPRPSMLFAQALSKGAFTLEAQVIPSDTSLRTIMAQGASVATDFQWATADTPRLIAHLGNNTATPGSSFQSGTSTVSSSVITHVALDWDGMNLNYYVNGSLDGAGTLTPGMPAYTANDTYSPWPLWIGAGNDGSGLPANTQFFKGWIRHAAVFAPNIGATRIAAHAALM